MSVKKITTVILPIIVGVVLMIWIYYGYDFSQVREMFSLHDNYRWILLALLAGFTANVARSLRWKQLLASSDINISVRKSIELVFISYLINSITPRLGEVTRCLLIKKDKEGVASRAFGTIIIEKIFDVLCLLGVLIVALLMNSEQTVLLVDRLRRGAHSSESSLIYFLIGGGVLIVLLVLWFFYRSRINTFVRNVWFGISSIKRLKNVPLFLFYSFFIWFCNFLQIYYMLPCFSYTAAFGLSEGLLLFGYSSVGMLFPTPSGMGPWHYAVISTLTTIYKVGAAQAYTFALITHGIKTLLVIMLGFIAYLSFYSSYWTKQLKRYFFSLKKS